MTNVMNWSAAGIKTGTVKFNGIKNLIMNKQLLSAVGIFVGIALFSAAVMVLHHELQMYHYHDIINEFNSIPRQAIGFAFLFTVLNFLVLGAYEILGLRYINRSLPWYKTILTSFIAFSFSNNVGFYSISGSAVRYRLYSQCGLSTLDIAKLVTFLSGITFWLGLCSICSLVFITEPVALTETLHMPFSSTYVIGILFLVPVIAFLTFTIVRKKPVLFRSWEFDVPSPFLSIALILLTCLDWIFFAAALYVLLPSVQVSFPVFLSIFLTAQVVGLVSHVPGGLGVFESMLIILLPGVPASASIGALLVFRTVYYLIPLAVSAALLGR